MDYVLGSYHIFKNKIISTNYKKSVDRIEAPVPWYRQYLYFYLPSQEIVNNLFLGSAFNAYNLYDLEEKKINVIINISNDINNYYTDKFIYHKFKIADNNSDDISEILEETYKIIITNLALGNKVFIHCFMGASRSASVIIYYLMKKYNITYKKAKKYVMKIRPIINLSVKFHKTLSGYSNVKF
jgi:hypothetical protein